MAENLIAVIDVGKTNAKLALVNADSGKVVWSAQRANRIIESPVVRQIDVLGTERWLLDELAHAPAKERISTLVPVAHGAAAVFVDASGKALQAPDYEDPGFDETRADYARERDAFASTFSPHLPNGQNLGAQLHFLESRHLPVFRDTAKVLLLPQYLAWRFCDVMASEVTSLGSHSDLWRPLQGRFSGLAERRGWSALFPPLRRAGDVLGCVSAEMARATGLDPSCKVVCGIHDSNASFLWHLYGQPPDQNFAVVSSGTWVIAMARGVDVRKLKQERDLLANVDAFGFPLGTARFMGGREYHAIAGDGGIAATPTVSGLRSVIAARSMALPSFARAGGPFPTRTGSLLGADGLNDAELAAIATLYVALVTDVMLDLLETTGNVVIDGPLAVNPLFGPLLGALRPSSSVLMSDQAAGPISGGFALVAGASKSAELANLRPVKPFDLQGLADYRDEWRDLCEP